jgi:hypothetical protein
MFAFSSPTLASRFFPVNHDFSFVSLNFTSIYNHNMRDIKPNIPVQSVAQGPVPESDPGLDLPEANSDRPSPASRELAASSPALPAMAPDRWAVPAPAPWQQARPAILQLELRHEIEWRPP